MHTHCNGNLMAIRLYKIHLSAQKHDCTKQVYRQKIASCTYNHLFIPQMGVCRITIKK